MTHSGPAVLFSHLLDALRGHEADDLCRHVEVFRGHIAQSNAVLGQQPGQRVNSTAMFQVSNHRDLSDKRVIIVSGRCYVSPPDWNLNFRVLTVMPLTVPSSSLMVKTSSRAWVGCSPTPSPALITGLRQ
ncbi:hypothetical protein GOODEAATRI_028919 [Goodea atripinnis]|uniref:Uncharacterized protein n=1 Tax=Goodea atripinnis TaxID=208336 RepID=A0ABV0NP19_9TELE